MASRDPVLLSFLLSTMVMLAGCHAPPPVDNDTDEARPQAGDGPDEAPPDSGTEQERTARPSVTPFNETNQSHVPVEGGRTVALGYNSGFADSRRLVIENRSDWEALWAQHEHGSSPISGAPDIDFTKERVVAAFAGNKPNGCFNIRITSVTWEADQNVTGVHVTEREPQQGDVCTQGFTQPFHMAASPADGTEVVFRG